MRTFLAVSVADRSHELCEPVTDALAPLGPAPLVIRFADGWVALSGTDDDDRVGPESFTVRLARAARTGRGDVSTADLAALLAGGDLTTLVPPFAAAHRAGPAAPTVIAADWLGFRQLYHWHRAGAAAVSTSARALAALAGGGLDDDGLATQALIGWQIADSTIFQGVRALPPASKVTLSGGRADIDRYADPPPNGPAAPSLTEAVDELAELLIDWQTAYLDDHPDTVLQLTGGHDSRILLGAIPAARRRGLRVLTLDSGGSADAIIAARLAERYGMRHHVHRMDEQPPPSPAEAHRLALSAAAELECSASPLALAPLLLAEAHLEQGHRLSGLGGEVARGFYYAGQPTGVDTSAPLVERLARWRLFSNEAVADEALDPGWLESARTTTIARLTRLFPAGDWLRATDGFYLWHRMHRWAAAHGTVAATRRHFINPMFDRRFIGLALAVAPADKRDSLLLGRLMTRLDRELATMPLDSGLIPARLGRRTVATRIATGQMTARKALRKVGQRLTRTRRAQLGAAGISDLVLAYWRAVPDTAEPLRKLPMLRQPWLDGLLAGEHEAEPATMAFLINLLATGESHRGT